MKSFHVMLDSNSFTVIVSAMLMLKVVREIGVVVKPPTNPNYMKSFPHSKQLDILRDFSNKGIFINELDAEISTTTHLRVLRS